MSRINLSLRFDLNTLKYLQHCHCNNLYNKILEKSDCDSSERPLQRIWWNFHEIFASYIFPIWYSHCGLFEFNDFFLDVEKKATCVNVSKIATISNSRCMLYVLSVNYFRVPWWSFRFWITLFTVPCCCQNTLVTQKWRTELSNEIK